MFPSTLSLRAGLFSLLFGLIVAPAAAQDPPSLRLDGVVGSGMRSSVTEAWGTFDFSITNQSDVDRQARLLFFYEGRPDTPLDRVQYGRDVWVPARATLSSWLLTGPVPAEKREFARSIQMLLYDRTDGYDKQIKPKSEERIRSREVLYRKREAFTTLYLDDEAPEGLGYGELPRPPSAREEIIHLARTLRGAVGLSSLTPLVRSGPLPVTPEAFDGIDHLVLASNRIAEDPIGLRTVRQWLVGGGTVWVMLDRVDADVVGPLLGDGIDFQVVDRLSLTTLRIADRKGKETATEHERPVEFVRVLLPPGEVPRHTLDGWPVWFLRPVGRGKIIFSTLAPRGWMRPRINPPRAGIPNRPGGQGGMPPRDRPFRPESQAGDPPSPFPDFPNLAVPLDHFRPLAEAVYTPGEENSFPADAFGPSLTAEIGYAVVGRGSVAIVFGGFLASVLVLALVLRGPRRREALGWSAPGLALVAAGVLLVLGELSRRAAEPTVAYGQVVEPAPGGQEASVRGLLAAYRTEGGPAAMGADQGGLFEIDQAGVEGQTRRLMLDDIDAWHWDDLTLPVGVRKAAFRRPIATTEPIRAIARTTAEGIEGVLTTGPFRKASDAVLLTPADRLLAVRLEADGTFRANGRDTLPADRFLAGTLLSDRQQRRQELYRRFLEKPPAHLRGRNILLAWADPLDMHFRLSEGSRMVGDALLVVPLELQPAAADTSVTVPAALVSYQRLQEGNLMRITRDFWQGAEQHLRFQLPSTVLPMQVERVRLTVRIDAASRRVTVSARDGEAFTEVHRVESPLDTVRVEIAEPKLLKLDEKGGLHLRLDVGDTAGEKKGQPLGPGDAKWILRSIELEVTGRTLPER